MARLVIPEDSDDDFPPLADLIRQHTEQERGTCDPKMMGSASRTARFKEPVSPNYDRALSGSGQNSDEEAIECKPRRRILNKKSDNPLLRPFGDEARKVTSSSLSKTSNLRPEARSDKKEPLFVQKNGLLRPEECSNSAGDDSYDEDSTGLSDFIVRDSSYLEDQELDYIAKSTTNNQRVKRKLVRGRRPSRQESPDMSIWGTLAESNDMKSTTTRSREIHRSNSFDSPTQNDRSEIIEERGSSGMPLTIDDQTQCSGLEESFHMLSFSPPRRKSPIKIYGNRTETPPPSPKKPQIGLVSPQKPPRIPSTPHRPSMDAFWSQDVVNEWNDEFSSRKSLKASPIRSSENSLSDDFHFQSARRKSPLKQARSVLEAKKAFASKKHEIAEIFLKEVDDAITDGKVSRMAASTGGIKIIWSKKLNTTAGRANWKRESIKSNRLGPEQSITYHHHASIELAEKIIDDEHRLLNVLAHEFCHLANFMISGMKTNPHGKEFKTWAAKCSKYFGHRGIEVTTKHSYVIDFKYIWECTNCGVEYKRHSKSIEPTKHQCGSCKSKLVQTKPALKVNGTLSEYQKFMKENMKRIKEGNPGSPHKEIMGLVGKEYQEYKATKLSTIMEKSLNVDVNIEEVVVSKEELPRDSAVDTVVRKLEFLDLTSA